MYRSNKKNKSESKVFDQSMKTQSAEYKKFHNSVGTILAFSDSTSQSAESECSAGETFSDTCTSSSCSPESTSRDCRLKLGQLMISNEANSLNGSETRADTSAAKATLLPSLFQQQYQSSTQSNSEIYSKCQNLDSGRPDDSVRGVDVQHLSGGTLCNMDDPEQAAPTNGSRNKVDSQIVKGTEKPSTSTTKRTSLEVGDDLFSLTSTDFGECEMLTSRALDARESDISVVPRSSSDYEHNESSYSLRSEQCSSEWLSDTSYGERSSSSSPSGTETNDSSFFTISSISASSTGTNDESSSSTASSPSSSSTETNQSHVHSSSESDGDSSCSLNDSSRIVDCTHSCTVFTQPSSFYEGDPRRYIMCYECGRFVSSSSDCTDTSSVSSSSSDDGGSSSGLERARRFSDFDLYPYDYMDLNSAGETTSVISESSEEDISCESGMSNSEASSISDESEDSAILVCTCCGCHSDCLVGSGGRNGSSNCWETSSTAASAVSVGVNTTDQQVVHNRSPTRRFFQNDSRVQIINFYVFVTVTV